MIHQFKLAYFRVSRIALHHPVLPFPAYPSLILVDITLKEIIIWDINLIVFLLPEFLEGHFDNVVNTLPHSHFTRSGDKITQTH